jgi:hypothetical protein
MFEDILNVINSLFISPVFPTSKYTFIKKCSKEDIKPIYNIECSECRKIGFRYDPTLFKPNNINCIECNKLLCVTTSPVKFISFPIKQQVIRLVNQYKNDLVWPNNKGNVFPLTDVFDGKIHKQVSEQHSKFISLNLNTDGVKLHKSSKKSLWPLLYVINNLPLPQRYESENISVAAIFIGTDIEMEVFLSNCVEDLDSINQNEGVNVIGYISLPVFCLSASIDVPATAKVLN